MADLQPEPEPWRKCDGLSARVDAISTPFHAPASGNSLGSETLERVLDDPQRLVESSAIYLSFDRHTPAHCATHSAGPHCRAKLQKNQSMAHVYTHT